uniref:TIR domain-containing protein n=1 Tax=Globisporangium ultimum (strain ATCC 200006 / CBS 805.95 / DAOM BR144) TaxID=431595 RepID=K3WZN0_GLOUD
MAYYVASVEWDLSTLGDNFVFISHGEKHASFAQRVCDRLTENGIDCILDGAQSYGDMADRIHAAKEAIARCSTFVVVISSKTVSSETLKDQLAFAEDKGRPILPIMLNDMEIGLDKHYTLSRGELFHFTPELGFNASFTSLLMRVQQYVKTTNNGSASFAFRHSDQPLLKTSSSYVLSIDNVSDIA